MPQTCTVCRHPDCEEVEVAIVRRTPYRHIATQYGLSTGALVRHAQVHLPETLAKSEEAREIASADSLMGRIQGLEESALSILRKAEAEGAPKEALGAIREARGCLELQAKVGGQIKDGPTINVLISQEWSALQFAIMGALEKHPEARLSVASALKQLEGPVVESEAA